MLKFGFWIVRDIKKKFLKEIVNLMCKIYFLFIIVLCKIKINMILNDGFYKKFGFNNFDYIFCVGRSGRIWLMWKEFNLSIEVIYKE